MSEKFRIRKFFFGLYFPLLRLNTVIYSVNLHIQSEYGKIRTRKNYLFGHFSHSVFFAAVLSKSISGQIDYMRLFASDNSIGEDMSLLQICIIWKFVLELATGLLLMEVYPKNVCLSMFHI